MVYRAGLEPVGLSFAAEDGGRGGEDVQVHDRRVPVPLSLCLFLASLALSHFAVSVRSLSLSHSLYLSLSPCLSFSLRNSVRVAVFL